MFIVIVFYKMYIWEFLFWKFFRKDFNNLAVLLIRLVYLLMI